MRIELHPAFVWDCDECGSENFCRSVVCELDGEELEDAKQAIGIDPWEEGIFQTVPTMVECSFCGCEFETE